MDISPIFCRPGPLTGRVFKQALGGQGVVILSKIFVVFVISVAIRRPPLQSCGSGVAMLSQIFVISCAFLRQSLFLPAFPQQNEPGFRRSGPPLPAAARNGVRALPGEKWPENKACIVRANRRVLPQLLERVVEFPHGGSIK